MLDFKALTLEDKKLFNKYLKPYKFKTCEYSFTNLFIWRKACDIQYAILDDVLIIKKMDFDGKYHFMQPIGYKKENLHRIVDILTEMKDHLNLEHLFKDIEEDFFKDLLDVCGDKFYIEEDRDNFDYIYESEKLISLSGKKLHKKKNNLNHFVKNYEYEAVPITHDLILPCIKAAREWCHKNVCKGYLLHELKSIEELLKNNEELNFVGMAVFIDNKVAAFTIGEKMNDDMAIIHIEKADGDIRGLYNFINKSFIEKYFSHIPFINREQDLGIEGLRKAKLTYMPLELVKKFIVNVKR